LYKWFHGPSAAFRQRSCQVLENHFFYCAAIEAVALFVKVFSIGFTRHLDQIWPFRLS
jgi:hypothetical protein